MSEKIHHLGISDDDFIRGKVPMTKEEIRILTIAKARIKPDSIVYDIGAGTGSISIEAARLAPKGRVYAIERKADGIELIAQNMEKFGVTNIERITAEAPDGMTQLPPTDAVIVGGSGHNLAVILDIACDKLKPAGRIIITAITMQTFMAALDYFRGRQEFVYEAIQVQVNRFDKVGGYDMAKALNPIYIVTAYEKENI